MLNYSIFQIISYQQCQMGLITVHLFSNHTHNKQALETCTEKQSTLNIREQPHNYQQFALIVQNTTLSQTQRIVPYFTYRRSPLNKRVAPQPSLRIHSWSQLFNNGQLLPKILSFVNGEDLLMLKYCNRLLRREALISILQKQNNWDLTFGLLAPYLLQQTHLRESGADQDLDRTSGYFQYQNSQDLQQHQLKLDRIITTVSFKIQYFQGIMPICANLLQCFNQHISYWLLRFLLHKCRYIQNDIQFYNKYICILEDQFQNLLPQVYRHLNHMGFQLNYFVMKWIMGLFSEDMSKTMALALWDLICQTDVFILIYAIVEIFRILSADILCSGEDEINTMIKINLKERLGNVKSEQLMKCIKQLYITRRLYKASIK